MKNKFYRCRKWQNTVLIGALAVMSQFLVACSSSDALVGPAQFTNFTNSGCKGNPFEVSSQNAQSRSLSKEETYELKGGSGGQLEIAHLNTTLSCEALIKTEVSIEDHTIIIVEKSTDDTDCVCLYDLKYTLDNLESTTYNVIIKRQNIDREGKAFYDPVVYKTFSFKYSPNMSITID